MDFGHQSHVRGWEGAKLLCPVVLPVMSPLPALGGSDLHPLLGCLCFVNPEISFCRWIVHIAFFLPFFLDPDLRLKTPFFPSSPPWLTWQICVTDIMPSVEWWRCRKENWISQRCVELLLITAVRKFWPLCAAIDRVIQLLPLPLRAHNTAGTAKSFGRGARLPPGHFFRVWVANCPHACTLLVENTSSGCWEKKKQLIPAWPEGRGAALGAPAWPLDPCPRLVLRPALHMHAPHHHLQMQWEETRSDESLGTGKAYDKHKN